MAKVLLIQPPHEELMQSKRRVAAFPYSIGYIAGQLVKNGHKVDILDIYSSNLSAAEVAEKIKTFGGEIVGISAFSTQYNYIKGLSEQIKKISNCRIVIGGPLATYSAEVVLKHTPVDACVVGEGELTMEELVSATPLDRIKGIYYRSNGTVIKNEARPQVEDLDNIPTPAYELFPMDIYLRHTHLMNMEHSERALSVVTGRGCPYNCNFCSKTFSSVRLRSVEKVIEEIELLKDNYKITEIAFQDELFVVDKKRTYEFVEKLAPLNLRWSCQGRVNIVDYPLLTSMRKAGCVMVGFGLESGNQEILNRMNKRVTVEQSERAMKAAIKAGLQIKAQLMFNYPGDTKETLEQTIEMMKRVGHPGRNFIPLTTALPGSKLYRECVEKGIIKNEEEYLQKLSYGYKKGSPVLINFTKLKAEELYPLTEWASQKIGSNYRRYVLTHPNRWGRIILNRIKNKLKIIKYAH